MGDAVRQRRIRRGGGVVVLGPAGRGRAALMGGILDRGGGEL